MFGTVCAVIWKNMKNSIVAYTWHRLFLAKYDILLLSVQTYVNHAVHDVLKYLISLGLAVCSPILFL